MGQLLDMARAVILLVCMGVVRPFSPSLMAERHGVAGELFQLPPADLCQQPKRPSVPSSGPMVLDLLTEPSDSGSDGEKWMIETRKTQQNNVRFYTGLPHNSVLYNYNYVELNLSA